MRKIAAFFFLLEIKFISITGNAFVFKVTNVKIDESRQIILPFFFFFF